MAVSARTLESLARTFMACLMGMTFRHAFIEAARKFCHLAPATELNNWGSKRQESLDRLARVVSQSLDMPKIFEWVGLRYQHSPVRAESERTRLRYERPFVLLPAVYLADQIAGDPEWLPHPVRLMGWAITKGEALLRRPDQSGESELLAGAALTATVVSASYFLTRLTIAEAYRRSKLLGWLTEIVLGWTCLAARNLEDEASLVLAAVDCGGYYHWHAAVLRASLDEIPGISTFTRSAAQLSRPWPRAPPMAWLRRSFT